MYEWYTWISWGTPPTTRTKEAPKSRWASKVHLFLIISRWLLHAAKSAKGHSAKIFCPSHKHPNLIITCDLATHERVEIESEEMDFIRMVFSYCSNNQIQALTPPTHSSQLVNTEYTQSHLPKRFTLTSEHIKVGKKNQSEIARDESRKDPLFSRSNRVEPKCARAVVVEFRLADS